MARIERQYPLPSISIDKNFLQDLIKIIYDINPEENRGKIEIIVKSEQEKSTFEKLEDFTNSLILPPIITSISIRIDSNTKSKKFIEFFLSLSKEPNLSYYRLMGYDDGKISTCKKQIDKLLDDNQNWHNILFQHTEVLWIFQIAASISSSFLLYKLIFLIGKISLVKWGAITLELLDKWDGAISFFAFFIVYTLIKNIYEVYFPFFELKINDRKRSYVWRFVFSTIILGLIVNLIWLIIIFIIKK